MEPITSIDMYGVKFDNYPDPKLSDISAAIVQGDGTLLINLLKSWWLVHVYFMDDWQVDDLVLVLEGSLETFQKLVSESEDPLARKLSGEFDEENNELMVTMDLDPVLCPYTSLPLGRKSPYKDMEGNDIYEHHVITCYQAPENDVEVDMYDDEISWGVSNYHAGHLPFGEDESITPGEMLIIGVQDSKSEEGCTIYDTRRWYLHVVQGPPNDIGRTCPDVPRTIEAIKAAKK